MIRRPPISTPTILQAFADLRGARTRSDDPRASIQDLVRRLHPAVDGLRYARTSEDIRRLEQAADRARLRAAVAADGVTASLSAPDSGPLFSRR